MPAPSGSCASSKRGGQNMRHFFNLPPRISPPSHVHTHRPQTMAARAAANGRAHHVIVVDAARIAERKKERKAERDRHAGVIAIDWPQEDAREGMAKEGRCKMKTKTRLLINASDVTERPRSRSDRGGSTN